MSYPDHMVPDRPTGGRSRGTDGGGGHSDNDEPAFNPGCDDPAYMLDSPDDDDDGGNGGGGGGNGRNIGDLTAAFVRMRTHTVCGSNFYVAPEVTGAVEWSRGVEGLLPPSRPGSHCRMMAALGTRPRGLRAHGLRPAGRRLLVRRRARHPYARYYVSYASCERDADC